MESMTSRYQASNRLNGWLIEDTATLPSQIVSSEIADSEIETTLRTLNTRTARTTNHIVVVTRRDGSSTIYAQGGLDKIEAFTKLADALAEPTTYSAKISRNGITVKEMVAR